MGHEPEPPTGCQRGGAFYDQPGVFERYRAHAGPSNPNLVMEEPAFLEELGSVDGLRVLDLGCGDATLGRLLLDAGCRSYVGIDGSMRMVHAAETILRGTNGKALHADIEDFSASSDAYDLVVSRMALHYVGDLEPVLAAAFESLSPSGRLVVTVVHPVITSHDARANTEELRGNWVVDDYFVAGPREQNWLGGTVVWHHRTVETYVAAVRRAGFDVTAVGEPFVGLRCASVRQPCQEAGRRFAFGVNMAYHTAICPPPLSTSGSRRWSPMSSARRTGVWHGRPRLRLP